jgi:dienelactone hydrolase
MGSFRHLLFEFILIVGEVFMARQQATGISPTTIRFGKSVGAVRALPKAKGKRPGVIILHERYGIDRHTKDLAVKLAQAGFVGLAPDLFHRFDGDRKAVLRGEQRVDLTDDGALEDLNRHHRRMPDRPAAAPACGQTQ